MLKSAEQLLRQSGLANHGCKVVLPNILAEMIIIGRKSLRSPFTKPT